MRRMSSAGRRKLSQREGTKLKAYRDSVGVATIGTGHTGRMSSPPVYMGMTITEAQADEYLTRDLAPVEAALAKALKVPVTTNEFDALASWLFNVGTGWAPKATVIKKLNLGDVKGAADALLMFSKPKEIVGRRKSERTQFLTPDDTKEMVVEARATVLAGMATKASTASSAATKAATAAPVAGVATIGGSIAASHPTTAAIIGTASIAVTLLSGLYAWMQRRKASILVANAGAHL